MKHCDFKCHVDLLIWLLCETIKATLPQAFKEHFSRTTCVIDCTETVLQRARSRSESCSHYYANNTVKYLVTISPSGVIMFISDAHGGKCSDRYITQWHSGFLDHLLAGDVVMGDCRFTVRDLLEERRMDLMPSLTYKVYQLTNEEVTHTGPIAHGHIHAERPMRRL